MIANDNDKPVKFTVAQPAFRGNMAFDLFIICMLSLATIAFIYMPVLNVGIMRPVFGITMAIFVPGYALVSAIFNRKSDLSHLERVAIAVVVSVVIVSLTGFAMNYSPWGVTLDPILACLTIFTIGCSVIAYLGRRKLPVEDRFSLNPACALLRLKSGVFDNNTKLENGLIAIAFIAVLLTVGALAYFAVTPGHGEHYTNFYLLGKDHVAANYPVTFVAGEPKPVLVGVMNHEGQDQAYTVVVALNNSSNVTKLYSEKVNLGDNQTWEKAIDLKPDRPGTMMNLEFLLYRGDEMVVPYRECNLWVNATAPTPVPGKAK